jgi:hypothetical protein
MVAAVGPMKTMPSAVGLDGAEPLADAVGLVRLEAVEAELVLLGVDGDGALAQLGRRAHDADGDLATVGDQDLLELGHGRLPLAARAH